MEPERDRSDVVSFRFSPDQMVLVRDRSGVVSFRFSPDHGA